VNAKLRFRLRVRLFDLFDAGAFSDAQNPFHVAKKAYSYEFPDFDPNLLALEVCRLKGFTCAGVRL
jgi:hypothetical protein